MLAMMGLTLSQFCRLIYPKGLLLSSVLAGVSLLGTPLPTQAAEQIVLKYSILRESVSVSELSNLANTGEVSPSLNSYLTLAQKKPQDLRQVLNGKIEVNPVFLGKILNSFAGNFLLDQVSEVIHTPSARASRESLRGALVTSALRDGNIRLIEVLENYPTSEVYVEGDRLAEIYQQIKGVVSQLPHLPF
jgi:hypothetical protein